MNCKAVSQNQPHPLGTLVIFRIKCYAGSISLVPSEHLNI